MKKGGKIVAIILAIVTAAAVGVGVLGAMSSKVDDAGYYDDYDVRNYYGCPNSKRVKKLNLKKNKRQR